MKKTLLCALASMVVAFVNSPALATTEAGSELIKMARSGVDEEVLTAYIETSTDTFDLDADDIITLKDLGVPSKIISEALRHGHADASDTAAAIAARETIQAASGDEGASAVLTTAAVAPPETDQNISFFYEALYPYGNWITIDGDWCWRPNAATISPDWAPYCRHGHWVWSDWGWCWVSDYSWGWAPFHYGRWFRHRTHGWCWMPDYEWGPAWVSWRRGGDYCGWAPLPPHTRYVNNEGFYYRDKRVNVDFEFNLTFNDYFFVPEKDFCDPHPWVYMVPTGRNRDMYRNTEHIRNSYGFEHDHIFNHGLPAEDISKITNRPVTPITIAPDNIKPGEPIHRGWIKENRLVIYKPIIAPKAPKNPTAVRVMMEKRQPVVVPEKQNIGNRTFFLKRETNAMQQTLKHQQERAQNSSQVKFHLEQAANYEQDSKKKAEYQSEAEIQSMNAQEANRHVVNIRQWKPGAVQGPAVMPQSRVVPQPTTENREQVRTQVRTQVQNEARVEQQRQPAMEQMIRTHAPQAPQVKAQRPPVSQPRINTPPAAQQNNGQRNQGQGQENRGGPNRK